MVVRQDRGVLLALRRIEASENKREYNIMYSIGTGKDWFAHRVQEWQLALRRIIEASENKREYNMYVQKTVKLKVYLNYMPSFCPGLRTIES
jgi:hypothetical protein